MKLKIKSRKPIFISILTKSAILLSALCVLSIVFSFSASALSLATAGFSLEDFNKYLETGSKNPEDYSDRTHWVELMPSREDFLEHYVSPFEMLEIDESEITDGHVLYIPDIYTSFDLNGIHVSTFRLSGEKNVDEYMNWYFSVYLWWPEEDITRDDNNRILSVNTGTYHYEYLYKQTGEYEVAYQIEDGQVTRLFVAIGDHGISVNNPNTIYNEYFESEEHRSRVLESLAGAAELFSEDEAVRENALNRMASAVPRKIGSNTVTDHVVDTSSKAPANGQDNNTNDEQGSGCGGFSVFAGFIALACAAGAVVLIKKK